MDKTAAEKATDFIVEVCILVSSSVTYSTVRAITYRIQKAIDEDKLACVSMTVDLVDSNNKLIKQVGEQQAEIQRLHDILDLPKHLALGTRIEKLELMELADECKVDKEGVNMRVTVIPSAVAKIKQLKKENEQLREDCFRYYT